MKKLEGEAWLQSRAKRAMDVGVVALFGPPAAVLAGVSATALAIEMQRKPWFYQERVGRSPVDLMQTPKLVTLRGPIDAVHSNGHTHERATPIGKIIRRLHIDEAPQLMLVARGQMSVVGARPAVMHEYEMTMDILSPAEQREYLHARSVVPPGIVTLDSGDQHTGQDTSPYEKAMNVITYARTGSMSVDMDLLCATATGVVRDTWKR
ncbi:MAG: sugar transferase [Candidatus Saccharimonadales bacterium]